MNYSFIDVIKIFYSFIFIDFFFRKLSNRYFRIPIRIMAINNTLSISNGAWVVVGRNINFLVDELVKRLASSIITCKMVKWVFAFSSVLRAFYEKFDFLLPDFLLDFWQKVLILIFFSPVLNFLPNFPIFYFPSIKLQLLWERNVSPLNRTAH